MYYRNIHRCLVKDIRLIYDIKKNNFCNYTSTNIFEHIFKKDILNNNKNGFIRIQKDILYNNKNDFIRIQKDILYNNKNDFIRIQKDIFGRYFLFFIAFLAVPARIVLAQENEESELSGSFLQNPSEFEKFKLVSCNGNIDLALEVAAHLRVQLARTYLNRFQDGECQIRLQDEIRGADVYVIQSSPSPEGDCSIHDCIMELLLTVSALRRASARRIIAVIPYLSYARQTQQFDPEHPKPIAASDIALMLETLGVDSVVFVDVHNPRMEGFFPTRIPCFNVDSQAMAVKYFKQKGLHKPMIVATDQGGENDIYRNQFWFSYYCFKSKISVKS
eukprot:GHVL01040680.1.p1 GENE.GHVL01040680.1~~GHVL01040680.1.p1  ORF type:complete len:340 (-),score=59.79 GHVL01040680.1:487-1482(-)